MTQWIRSSVNLLSICALLSLGSAGSVAQDSARDDASSTFGPIVNTLDASYRAPVSTEGGSLLYDNGPLVNNPGGGVGGADESVLQNNTLGMTTYGFGHQVSQSDQVADDFTVTGDEWTVDSLVFWAYQTNSGTTSTITEVRYQVWDGPPNNGASSIIFGDLTTNRMTGTTWGNIYRADENTSGTSTNRPIMKNTVSGGFVLTSGTYWIEWTTNGSLGSGPWAPPITITGQSTTGNALQWVGLWQNANDGGSGTQQGFPFQIYGTVPIAPPSISFSPSSMAFTLAPETSDSTILTITNTGGEDLTFTLSDDAAATRANANKTLNPERESYEPAKGEPDLRKGDPQLNGMGGPDLFGHFWIDSDEPGGPTFGWTDITGSGTAVVLGDDASLNVALPFTFNYYGNDKTAVDICSNGYLTFSTVGNDFSNDPIPSTTDPDDIICGFWDDLDPSVAGGGTIHYLSSGTEFIVQYTNLERYAEPTSLLSFQMILYPSGEILYQYLSMVGTLNLASIGIENIDGTDGLQVVNNAAYVHDNLAVLTYMGGAGGGDWLSQNPISGTVPAGGSVDVQVIANSAGLTIGSYNATLTISSNDPAHPDTTMPVSLNVSVGVPVINVTPTSISETLAPNDSVDVTITVQNNGLADLDWAAAITSSAIQGRTVTGRQVVLTTEPKLVSRAGLSLVGARGLQSNPPTEGGISLIVDDGTKENGVGLTSGGQFIWLNRFTPAPADFPFTLDDVQILFDAADGVNVGEIVDIYIYEDTDGDGNPGTGAVNLGSIVGSAVQATDGITWSVYTTSVSLNGPGDVILAVVNRTAGVAAGTYPAAIDQTASQVRSWVGAYTVGNPPNPPPLPATSLWGEIGTFGLAGNWMVRGAGTAGGGGGTPEWISLIGTTSGTVTPGNSATFDVRLRGVASPTEGDTTYTGTIEITSNDPATPSVIIDVTLMVIAAPPPEPQMSLTHTPGNLNMGIFNDASIGAEQVAFTGPGITWNGVNGCFVGGPIFGTTAVGAVNGLIGSFAIYGDLVNVSSNFAGGFTSDGDFDQIASADLDDSGAAAPYGVKMLQRSYSNTGEEAGFIRYGYVNNSGNDLTDFYSGIFVDWDIDNYLTNSGGYDVGRNMIYEFDAVGADPYFGLIALDGMSGGRATTATPPGSPQAGSFEYITTSDFTIPANGDFRMWIGSGPSNMDPGDTVWASYAVVAGGNLAELQANADAAVAKATAVGWIGTLGVGDPTAEIPAEFGLAQNYPNPFNPATRITYALPTEASVTLKVYNVLGQEVITLENSVQQAGVHEVSWNAKNTLGQSVGSGVYFYRMEAQGSSGETFANLKKMLFLK